MFAGKNRGNSNTPKSDEAVPIIDCFHANVRRRFQAAKPVYGDASFEVPIDRVIAEIQEELEDVAGWSAIMWARLEGMKGKL